MLGEGEGGFDDDPSSGQLGLGILVLLLGPLSRDCFVVLTQLNGASALVRAALPPLGAILVRGAVVHPEPAVAAASGFGFLELELVAQGANAAIFFCVVDETRCVKRFVALGRIHVLAEVDEYLVALFFSLCEILVR